MKKTILFIVLALLSVSKSEAQVISFSMEAEAAEKNTPEGWKEVDLPKNLPAFTASNTFYINDAQFGASTSSADNTKAIQAALDKAAAAGGGMVVVPAGEWLFGRIKMGSKTVLHLCAGATLKLLPYSEQSHTLKDPYICGKSGASRAAKLPLSKARAVRGGMPSKPTKAACNAAPSSGSHKASVICSITSAYKMPLAPTSP